MEGRMVGGVRKGKNGGRGREKGVVPTGTTPVLPVMSRGG